MGASTFPRPSILTLNIDVGLIVKQKCDRSRSIVSQNLFCQVRVMAVNWPLHITVWADSTSLVGDDGGLSHYPFVRSLGWVGGTTIRNSHEFLTNYDYTGNSYETHMRLTWNSHETHMWLTWDSRETHMKLTWDLHEYSYEISYKITYEFSYEFSYSFFQ